jgi:hypothetical protein
MMKGVNFTFMATNKAGPAMSSFQSGLRAVQKQTQQATTTNASWMKSMNANRRTIQQVGFQVTDLGVQLAGGQSAMLAFIQQGGQLLQFFGAGGAAAAALLTVFGTMALIIMRSGIALSELTPILGVLEEDFRTLAVVIGQAKEIMIDAINLIVNNLDTLLIAAGGFAIYFGGPWLMSIIAGSAAVTALRGVMLATALSFRLGGAGAAAMTLATSTLTGVVNVLRVALMRLGLPALVIGLAYMIERIMTLREKTGSWAEVLKLLGDVAKGVWTGIIESAKAIPDGLSGVWSSITSDFYNMVSDLILAWSGMLNSMGNAIQGIMPGMADSLWASATDAIQSSTRYAEAANAAADQSAVSFKRAGETVTNAWAPAAAALQKIKDILGTDTQVDIRDWFGGDEAGADGAGGALEKLAKALEDVRALYGKTVAQFQALGPLGAVGITQLNKLWTEFVQNMKTTSNPAGVIEQFKFALGEAGRQAQQLYDAVRSPLEDMFMSMVDGTKSVKDAFKSMATSVIKELFRIMVVQKLVNSILGFFGVTNPAAAVAPMAAPSFAGGGYTGYGARSGGVDGKGGFPAILHPNETVVDHTMGDGSGVTVNQTISFGSGVTRAEVQSMIPKIVEATKSAVLDARKRGGAYGSAFG